MTSSVRLPSVALSRPPTASPVFAATLSVALLSSAASGTMASTASTNSAVWLSGRQVLDDEDRPARRPAARGAGSRASSRAMAFMPRKDARRRKPRQSPRCATVRRPREATMAEPPPPDRPKSRSLRPLRALLPYLAPHRADAAAGARRAAGRLGRDARAAGGAALPDRRGHGGRQPRHDQPLFRRVPGGRRGVRRVRRAALLLRHLARRARRRRPALGRVRTRDPHGSGVLRGHAHRRGAVAPDRRHHAGAVHRRREPVDHAALDDLDRRAAW